MARAFFLLLIMCCIAPLHAETPSPSYASSSIEAPIGDHSSSSLTNQTTEQWITSHSAPPAIRLAQNSEFANESATPEAELSPSASMLKGNDRGLFQGYDISADWLPQLDDDSLGRSSFSTAVKFGVPPWLTVGTPLLVTPRWGLQLLDGPASLDAPARLHEFELGFRAFRPLNDRWLANVGVTVGVYGDDYSLGKSDALRVSGQGIAIYSATKDLQWAIGVAYLNRDDLSVIPVAGVIYDQGWVRYELMMPRPRILWRLEPGRACTERALYLAGELGGGVWAVRRTNGSTDTLNLSRYGLMIGYEQKTTAGFGRRYEFGYVFGRDIEYGAGGEDFSLKDSLIARASLFY